MAPQAATAHDDRRLVSLLCEAAELEHALVCQYLFAAFSFKRSEDEGGVTPGQLEWMRRWEANLLLVARQEMEHLAAVSNLLTALGQAPHLQRPNLPLKPSYYKLNVNGVLEPFGTRALRRFIKFEMPAAPTAAEQARLRKIFGRDFKHTDYLTIGKLYAEIERRFSHATLIGPLGAEIVTDLAGRGVVLETGPSYGVVLRPVDSTEAAERVIRQIILEGEGTKKKNSKDSHFARFCLMYEQLQAELKADPSFKPARPVVKNSELVDLDALIARNRRNKPAVELIRLFDFAYETLLLMMFRFLGRGDENTNESGALQEAAFFPMMTMVIRPLGEILTRQPIVTPSAGAQRDKRAGPRFEFDRPTSLLPHRKAADTVIYNQLDMLAEQARRYAAASVHAGAVGERLSFVAQDLGRIAENFALATGVGGAS